MPRVPDLHTLSLPHPKLCSNSPEVRQAIGRPSLLYLRSLAKETLAFFSSAGFSSCFAISVLVTLLSRSDAGHALQVLELLWFRQAILLGKASRGGGEMAALACSVPN